MTLDEFSTEFDVLYNNITSNQAPGLDEYEKSVFLTRAQDDILKSYFDPVNNKSQKGFDGNEIRQIDFSSLVVHSDITSFTNAVIDPRTSGTKSVTLPSNVLMILNEVVTVTRGTDTTYLQAIPLAYTEYTRLMSKPYKRPLVNQAWRIQIMDTSSKADIIAAPNDTINKYSIRYVKRPNPIILVNLEDVSIDGSSTATNCELDPILHREILQRAVELAKGAYAGDISSQIILGQNSGTDIGRVAAPSGYSRENRQ